MTEKPIQELSGVPGTHPVEAEVQPQPKAKSRFQFYSIVFVILLLLAAIAVPNFVKVGTMTCGNSCIGNLKQIDGAKQQWALENQQSGKAQPTVADVVEYLKGDSLPECPAGGSYTLHIVMENPVCNVSGHTL